MTSASTDAVSPAILGRALMAMHITQSSRYRDLSLDDVTDEAEAFLMLTEFAFGDRKIFPCPLCNAVDKHYLRAQRKQWRCKACDGYFSPTSGTALHKRKISCKKLVMAIIVYVTTPQGTAATVTCANLNLAPKTVWLLFSKIRESMVLTTDISPMSGMVQADGGHFCGKPRRPNRRKRLESVAVNAKLRGRKAAIDPTLKRASLEPWNRKKLEKRRVVTVLRQMGGERGLGAIRTMVSISRAENADSVVPFIKKAVTRGSVIWTDSGNAYSPLSLHYHHEVVNHSREYCSPEGVNNNQAESYFSRLRRGEYGVFRAMRPNYFLDYCVEMAWREDMRRKTVREKVLDIVKRVRGCGPSPSFCGYHQGVRRLQEWTYYPEPRPKTGQD